MAEAQRMVAIIKGMTCELTPDRGTWQCIDKYGLQDQFTSTRLRDEYELWISRAGPAMGEPMHFAFVETVRVFKGKITINTPDPEVSEYDIDNTVKF